MRALLDLPRLAECANRNRESAGVFDEAPGADAAALHLQTILHPDDWRFFRVRVLAWKECLEFARLRLSNPALDIEPGLEAFLEAVDVRTRPMFLGPVFRTWTDHQKTLCRLRMAGNVFMLMRVISDEGFGSASASARKIAVLFKHMSDQCFALTSGWGAYKAIADGWLYQTFTFTCPITTNV
jgi:hypothetical protein